MQLQESGEMYLECILRLSREIGNVRSIDIGEYRGFSKPSISRAMKHLKEGGFINVDENGFITLTEPGEPDGGKNLRAPHRAFRFVEKAGRARRRCHGGRVPHRTRDFGRIVCGD